MSAHKTIRDILVPTDFGEPAEQALTMAIALAQKLDANITLLHVHPVPIHYGYGGGLYWPAEELTREATKAIDAAVAKAKERYPRVEGALRAGDSSEGILKSVAEGRVDLVVMGTHGRQGLSHLVFGSVAEKVVRQSPVPVLTVGPRLSASR
jgi:nucleotide-binding universal stress UspA family protein